MKASGFPGYFSFTQLYIPSHTKTSWQNQTKISLLWSRVNAKNRVFVLPYHISWQRIAICCAVTVDYGHFSCRHNSAKRLCQRIKHRFVACISFWRIQNLYKEMGVIRSLFYRYIACNLHRVAHDNGDWRRLSMAVATERCWVERLSCKGSRT